MTDGIRILGNLYGCGSSYAGNIYYAPALMTMQGGNRQPMIIEEIYERILLFKIPENGIRKENSQSL